MRDFKKKRDVQNRYRRTKKKKKRWIRILALLSVLLAAFVGYGGWKVYLLNRIIEKKFNVTHRWKIPSRVYSDTEYLYPGLDVGRRGLQEKLERLAYRRVEGEAKGPGDFVWEESKVDIYLHDFQYPQEKFVGFPVRLVLEGQKIKEMIDLESNEKLTLVRLEPEEVATLFDEKMEDRTLIKLGDCPQYLLEAVILIEDERFFDHHGVDPIAILRAALADVITLRMSQGGSTLTQQLVKNFFLTSQKSFVRKFNEMLMAIIIESKYSKAEILTAYLNEIYLGQRGPSSVTGVGEAAKHYFAKDIHQLTLAESALMAGMIRYPSRYSPLNNMDAAIERRNFVLKRMWEAGVIENEEEYKAAVVEKIIPPKTKVRPVFAPYFIDFVRQQLAYLYPQEVLETEGLKIFTTLDMSLQRKAERAVQESLAKIEKDYAYLLPKEHSQSLQGCIIVLTPQNGYVRAMVGGREYGRSQFNRCVQAKRQPGSTFKPFVYLTAMDGSRSRQPFTPATLIDDSKFTTQTALGPWTPSNYDHKEYGWITVRTALEKSLNISTAKIAMDAGLEEVIQTARDAGFTSYFSPVPSLALGAFEVSPLEMVSAYTVFPNYGVKAEALSIINVMTPEGDVLEHKLINIKRVFKPAPVALIDHMLKGVMEHGTAASAHWLGFEGIAAGKTGTTSNYRDAWFVGFTPDLLALTWVGYDDNASMHLSGSQAALPVWVRFMRDAVGNNREDFTFPGGIVEVKIDPETGCVASKTWEPKINEYFIRGTEPEEMCGFGEGLPSGRSAGSEAERPIAPIEEEGPARHPEPTADFAPPLPEEKVAKPESPANSFPSEEF